MNIDYNSLLLPKIKAQAVREFPDRGVKWLLESPENVHALMNIIAPDFVALFLLSVEKPRLPHPKDFAENIDFSRLKKEPKSFIPDNLREQEERGVGGNG